MGETLVTAPHSLGILTAALSPLKTTIHNHRVSSYFFTREKQDFVIAKPQQILLSSPLMRFHNDRQLGQESRVPFMHLNHPPGTPLMQRGTDCRLQIADCIKEDSDDLSIRTVTSCGIGGIQFAGRTRLRSYGPGDMFILNSVWWHAFNKYCGWYVLYTTSWLLLAGVLDCNHKVMMYTHISKDSRLPDLRCRHFRSTTVKFISTQATVTLFANQYRPFSQYNVTIFRDNA